MKKRTPLYPVYQLFGAKIFTFSGWELPVQFSSIMKEHEAVRSAAGLFDVSHMGELLITGENSFGFLQQMLTNDLTNLKVGKIQYSFLCSEKGTVVDDLLVYRLSETDFMLVVNAANIEKDLDWLREHADNRVKIDDISDQFALLAIQGPKAAFIIQKLTKIGLGNVQPFSFEYAHLNGYSVLLSRTGYTGEDGFEIYCSPTDAIAIWHELIEAGKEDGLLPCGLGARDTLRFEANLPLYGQEIGPDITPLEAGLCFAVKLNKIENFIGKDALLNEQVNGVQRTIVGLEMIDRGIPRTGYKVFAGEAEVGIVTTGTKSPTLNKNLACVLIDSSFCEVGTEVEVEIRGKRLRGEIVSTPFYSRRK